MLRAESAAAPPTAQQIYNEAQTAFDNADWPRAINGFVLNAKKDDGGKMSHSQGVIHARLAQAYAHDHWVEKALSEATLALDGLAPNDDEERALMWLAVGEAQRLDLAIAEAISSYKKGLESSRKANDVVLIAGAEIAMALCYMTVDPAQSVGLLDTVLAAPEIASTSAHFRAQLYDARGRASLNLGQAEEAIPFLSKAVELSGGLVGLDVNLLQIGIRGDAAIGALLTKHEASAHNYLNMTGAGHLDSDDWTRGFGDPPQCSEASGTRPNDMAVVEFSIGADGHVTGAAPVYANRPGTVGIAFARAVKGWTWNPKIITGLPSFWRNMVRIEVRCISHPYPPNLSEPFRRDTREWLASSGLSSEETAPLMDGYVAGDDVRLQREDLAAVPVLFARLRYETDYGRSEAIARHLTAALNKAKAPVAARALAIYLQPVDSSHSSWSTARVRTMAEPLATLERTDPNSAATGWLTLEYALALEYDGRFSEVQPILDRVLSYPRDVLGEHDPVREVAILHQGALLQRTGKAAGAGTKVNATAATHTPCGFFYGLLKSINDLEVSSDFPEAAQRWGFDGYTRETFDIDAAGHVQNVRTVIAYPPFVFSNAAENSVARIRYPAPVGYDNVAGCEGKYLGFSYHAYRPSQSSR